MTWNKKKQEFALSCGIRPSTIQLTQWILRRVNDFQASEKIIDLREFNSWVGKHRLLGKYDRKTIKEAAAQLNDLTFGWITILKSYTWSVHKILVRPVEIARSNKSQSLGKTPKLPTLNSMFDASHKKRSREQLLQNISKLDTLFSKLGMKYTPDALMRLWRYADKQMSNVETAIEYMLNCHREKLDENQDDRGVRKPKGWLHDCLKYGWYINWDTEPDIQLPYFDSILEIANFVKGISNQTQENMAVP
ncbi:MAG: hypothetical protein QNJ72_25765 [Pleurocapsa sp. MO_226.B13]|nr:hypothetical protein [Pleurocapsa sp. MO_226.B13]